MSDLTILKVWVDEKPVKLPPKKRGWWCRIFHRSRIVIGYNGMEPITICRRCILLGMEKNLMLTIADLFKLQSTLNERVGLDDEYFARQFNGVLGSHDFPPALIKAGEWIDDILKAISSEIEKLRNCTYWSREAGGQRYRVKDVEAARKEVIDLLHLWISLAQILGMSPEMVCGMYSAKLAKNLKRQDEGYSIEVKDLAWKLFNKYPYNNPIEQSYMEARSLEDLSDEVAAHYIDWAEAAIDWRNKNES